MAFFNLKMKPGDEVNALAIAKAFNESAEISTVILSEGLTVFRVTTIEAEAGYIALEKGPALWGINLHTGGTHLYGYYKVTYLDEELPFLEFVKKL